jgi:hypothetical protein
VPEDLAKYSGPDLVAEGKDPLEVYNICCENKLVRHRDGGPPGICQNYAGQLRLLSQPQFGDFISDQLRGLAIRTQHLRPLW